MSYDSGNCSRPLPHDMPWDNIGSRWVIPGQNLIDLNLEERQYSRQIYHFLNIDKENKLGGKHTVFFKLLLSLLGEPTWSQSLAEIHRIFISLKTNISSGKKKHCLAQGLSAKCLHIRRWLELGFHTQEHACKGQACTANLPHPTASSISKWPP